MWVFTTDGFYSVVEHREDPSQLLVRARAREDLVAMRRALPEYPFARLFIEHTPDADYAYRMLVPREAWEQYLRGAVDRIDYPNFKDAVSRRQGWQRSSLYHDVWAAMMPLQMEAGDVVPDDTRGREAGGG